ncbi:hypothetical protein MXB_2741 [Myxobolus squamalis]|nr:hypothetical protein MXB_2741 [Myxobolus squamalis]
MNRNWLPENCFKTCFIGVDEELGLKISQPSNPEPTPPHFSRPDLNTNPNPHMNHGPSRPHRKFEGPASTGTHSNANMKNHETHSNKNVAML